MATVLITGAGGMLASDLAAVLRQRGIAVVGHTRQTLDISDRAQSQAVVRALRPGVIIHTAAQTNVDRCQTDPDAGYGVNTIGTLNMALAARSVDAVFVYVSTCGVFDGRKAARYHEFDTPAPLTHYHNSKYQARSSPAITSIGSSSSVRAGYSAAQPPTRRTSSQHVGAKRWRNPV